MEGKQYHKNGEVQWTQKGCIVFTTVLGLLALACCLGTNWLLR